ncbi:C40 family peptidase [Rufibacter sediminis]|uniref:C40 family peptidase n=1 Tax=Rufibacter sediminis TaxID=2762756 RepID=A0ABR6VL87_9BACT|nr:C40 family peptidase [Rufibacter sediminis]MBC3538049.1 C40 family peptidase [Rufibacter sediminis]
MKKIWIIFGVLLASLVLYKTFWGSGDLKTPGIKRTSLDAGDQAFHNDSTVARTVNQEEAAPALGVLKGKYATKADSVVAFALQRYGTEYTYGGVTEEGFDCSGFLTYVYGQFGVTIPHGSSAQAKLGESVAVQEAKKGDLIVFTGTNLEDRTPGHVGIVITNPPKAVQFVHSSSNGGVKVSELEGTLYQKRFLDIRRVLP